MITDTVITARCEIILPYCGSLVPAPQINNELDSSYISETTLIDCFKLVSSTGNNGV